MVRYRAPRRRFRWGPFYMNTTGLIPKFSSWGIKWWRFGHNVTRGESIVDTPGPGSVSHRWGKKRGRR